VKINTPLLVMHKDDLARLHLGTKFQDVEVAIKQDDSSPSVGRVFQTVNFQGHFTPFNIDLSVSIFSRIYLLRDFHHNFPENYVIKVPSSYELKTQRS